MTGYTVHTGASKKFVSGWDRIFNEGDGAKELPKGKTKAAKAEKKDKKKKTKK